MKNKLGSKMKSIYVEQFRQSGYSPASLGCPKGRQDIRFEALTSNIKSGTLLDYGCGFGDLSKFLEKNKISIDYTGCDVVPEFIETAKNENQGSFFLMDTISDKIDNTYDYIICSGVFNFMYSKEIKEHEKVVFERIKTLFNSCDKILSIDFQSPYVDFIQQDSFHQDICSLTSFISKNITRKFLVDHSYLPYEFCIHIYKNDRILRPENTFEN